MPRYERISVIVPALNEEGTLRELYDRVRAALGPEQPFEFIVVDDGSRDGTFELLRALHAEHGNVVAVRHGKPHGKSLALMQGFDVARGEVAVLMDADLQDLPEEIPRFLAALDEGYDLVNGWRHARRDTWLKNTVSRVFNLLSRRLLRCPLHDINCGFKAMRRTVYTRLELNGDMHRLIPAIALGMGYRVTEVPIAHAPRVQGTSRYRLLRHRGVLDIVAFLAANTTQARPFHVFTEIGLLFWAVAAVCFGGGAWAYLADPASPGAHVLAGLLAAVGLWGLVFGALLPILGLHLDFIARHLQGRPWRESLVREVLGPREREAS